MTFMQRQPNVEALGVFLLDSMNRIFSQGWPASEFETNKIIFQSWLACLPHYIKIDA